jgi:hypothetical protein
LFFKILGPALCGLTFLFSLPSFAQINLSSRHPVFQGWQVSLSAPILLGNIASSNIGLSVNNQFPLGQWSPLASVLPNLSVGVSAQAFAPLDFQAMYVGASAGVGYYHRLGGGFVFDYGVRYAPLYRVGFIDGVNQGYQGILGNMAIHVPVAGNTFSTFGLQGGAYFAGNGSEPLWTLQPIVGLNVNF